MTTETRQSFEKNQNKRLLKLLVLIIITPLIAGSYGALHNQISYRISPEYFTKFKILQFDLVDMFEQGIDIRIIVAIIGFQATWSLGFPIGFLIGIMTFVRSKSNKIIADGLIGISTCLFTTLIAGIVGYLKGINTPIENIKIDTSRYLFKYGENIQDFYTAGSVHNAGYLGAAIGLVLSLIVLFRVSSNHALSNSSLKKSSRCLILDNRLINEPCD